MMDEAKKVGGKHPYMPEKSYKKDYPKMDMGKLGNYQDSQESIDAFGRAARQKLQKQVRQS